MKMPVKLENADVGEVDGDLVALDQIGDCDDAAMEARRWNQELCQDPSGRPRLRTVRNAG